MNDRRPLLLALLSATLLLASPAARAGNATWNLNPTSGDWNTAANWTPATVPNSTSDIATFAVSNITDISISQETHLFSMVFDVGAQRLPFHYPAEPAFHDYNAGLQNNSGVVQAFDVLAADTADDYTSLAFGFDSNAGTNALIIAHGASVGDGANPGFTQFLAANAGNATLINNGGLVSGAKGVRSISLPPAKRGPLGSLTKRESWRARWAVGHTFFQGAQPVR